MGEQANSFSQPELSQEQGAFLGAVLGHCARHWDDSRPQGKLVSLEEVLQQGFWEREEVPALSLGSFGCSLCCTIPTPAWVLQPRQNLAAAGRKR